MNTPRFKTTDSNEISRLALLFADQGHRKLSAVHIHHTFIPNIALFDELVASLGDGQAAGQELCGRMWRHHTVNRGWSDIGQHVTIDPEGTIWLNRPWDKPPASSRGFNGSFDLGPFMIEMIGNFDVHQEKPTKAQTESMLATISGIQTAFDLPADALFFHNELNRVKSCPGSSIDKAKLIADIESYDSKQATTGKSKKRGKIGTSESANNRLVQELLYSPTGARSAGYSDAELLGEPEEDEMTTQAFSAMTQRGLTAQDGTKERGSFVSELTPFMSAQIKPHVINLRQGRFSDSGDFTTTRSDVDHLVDQELDSWVKQQIKEGTTPRIMIHAHGGLNKESYGLAYAHRMYQWWLDQGIYPIYFVWETGIIESFMQLLEEYGTSGQRGIIDDLKSSIGEIRDTALEEVIRAIGRDFWTIMKISASRASDNSPGAGAHYLAQKLEALYTSHNEKIEFNAVGHSAGAIFQAYFMRECNEGNRHIPFENLSLLAPACTIDLFNDYIKPRVNDTQIKHVSIYNLDRQTERADPTVPIYGKSLLHLVAAGFEEERNTPILGMDTFVKKDKALTHFLGLGSEPNPRAALVLSPNQNTVNPVFNAQSETHGGFSSDYASLQSIALRILKKTDANDIPPFKQPDSATRGSDRLFTPLRQRLDPDVYSSFFSSTPAANTGSLSTSNSSNRKAKNTVLSGTRDALCIGIDKYPLPGMALSGCVNDAIAWQQCFESLDFKVNTLHNEEATYQAMLDAITNMVSRSKNGDIVVIQFAGHGIRFEDLGGDEADRMDEALVPINNQRKLFLSDDELWTALQSGPDGVNVYVFMDCCHSMTNTRAMPVIGLTPRIIIPDREMTDNHRKRLRQRGVRSSVKSIELMKHVKYAACADSEFAYESDGHGKFTLAATAAIRDLGQNVSNHDFILEIEKHFANDSQQHPGLECPTERKGMPFLCGIV